jgi:hypothetical protein
MWPISVRAMSTSTDTATRSFVTDSSSRSSLPRARGARADLTTVPPLRAPQLAGTRQALDRTQRIAVDVDGRAAALARLDLLGALVVKACAAASDRVLGPQRHLEDLARLCGLVTDPAARTLTRASTYRSSEWGVLDTLDRGMSTVVGTKRVKGRRVHVHRATTRTDRDVRGGWLQLCR